MATLIPILPCKKTLGIFGDGRKSLQKESSTLPPEPGTTGHPVHTYTYVHTHTHVLLFRPLPISRLDSS